MKLVAVKWRNGHGHFAGSDSRGEGRERAIELLVENDDFYQTAKIDYHEGERYPHLESDCGKADVLGEIAKAKAPPVR